MTRFKTINMQKIKVGDMFEELQIGARVYAVSNTYAGKKKPGGTIKVCRIKTFTNIKGKIVPVLTVVGNAKMELSTVSYKLFVDLPEAINSIRS